MIALTGMIVVRVKYDDVRMCSALADSLRVDEVELPDGVSTSLECVDDVLTYHVTFCLKQVDDVLTLFNTVDDLLRCLKAAERVMMASKAI